MNAPSSEAQVRRWRVSRRGFLIGASATGVLAVGTAFGLDHLRTGLTDRLDRSAIDPETLPKDPMLWVEIAPDNIATLFVPKVEMGQGVHTSLGQILADELSLSWQQLKVAQADTSRAFDPTLSGTFGSNSVSALFLPLRQAGAQVRQLLLEEAARQLEVPVESLLADRGRIVARTQSERMLTYGQVVAAKTGAWRVSETPPNLKNTRDFQYIGKTMPRVDALDKITGHAVYGYDARVPGMLFGAVARPRRYGARLAHAAAGGAAAMPGVVRVVLDGDLAGVVARTRPQAWAALEHLDLTWEGGTQMDQDELERLVRVPGRGGTVVQRTGSLPFDWSGVRSVEGEYRTPLAAHAHLEPQAALADVRSDRVEMHISTQAPVMARDAIANAIDRPPEQVVVHPAYLGGGFGRKFGQDVGIEAARLSKAVARPVHVGWTRSEDLLHDNFRPPAHYRLRGSLDDTGRLRAIESNVASGDVFFALAGGMFGSIIRHAAATVVGFDPGSLIGSHIAYDVPHIRVLGHRVELPFMTGPWRGLGLYQNVFALESFVDELAQASRQDPLDFRLRHLREDEDGKRFGAVLQRAAEMSGWRGSTPEKRARGMAMCKDSGTFVAMVAEVSREDETLRVHRVDVAVDAGLVVNPQGARGQAQGSVVMGLSSALIEEVTLHGGMATATNFDAYPLLTLARVPGINVEFLSSDKPPSGLGEPVIGPVAAAVANAAYVLTGQRLRRLPLRLTA